jgi:WD40 repeat protein
LNNPRLLRFLHGHTAAVSSLAFSPDGRLLASGSLDKSIGLWDTATWEMVGDPLLGHKDEILSVVFNADGKTMASAGHDSGIFLWDVASGTKLREPLQGHKGVIESLAIGGA